MRRIGQKTGILALFLLFSCTAIQQQKSQPPAADDLHFRNLQVLPQNISRDELITTMRRFSQALGVGCDYCHTAGAPVAGQEAQLDFPSDAKREKHAARLMIRMTNRINGGYISRVPDAHTTVSCWTCHRGEAQPEVVPSLPPQERQAASALSRVSGRGWREAPGEGPHPAFGHLLPLTREKAQVPNIKIEVKDK